MLFSALGLVVPLSNHVNPSGSSVAAGSALDAGLTIRFPLVRRVVHADQQRRLWNRFLIVCVCFVCFDNLARIGSNCLCGLVKQESCEAIRTGYAVEHIC